MPRLLLVGCVRVCLMCVHVCAFVCGITGRVVRVRIRAFVSLLCVGGKVAYRRCVNSMCTLSHDKMHTFYHGHSRVPRPTALFHCKHPHPGTPSVAFPFREMCSMTKTPGPGMVWYVLRQDLEWAQPRKSQWCYRSPPRSSRCVHGFQCKATHSIRLMEGGVWWFLLAFCGAQV